MNYTILLDSKSDLKAIEAQEQVQFVMSIVEALEIPFDWDPNAPFGMADKLRLKKALAQYNVSIVDDSAGSVEIYLENQPIAHWFKATYILKEDSSKPDPKQRLYIEMRCNFTSIFETPPTT